MKEFTIQKAKNRFINNTSTYIIGYPFPELGD